MFVREEILGHQLPGWDSDLYNLSGTTNLKNVNEHVPA
jgi:hypothetical protein